MAHHTKESLSVQVQSQFNDLESSEGLPFRHLLSAEKIVTALQASGIEFRDRVFTPLVTLWAFLSQVVARERSSCCDAVSRVIADRVFDGKSRCSPDTSSYCKARTRLPLEFISNLVREIGQQLHRQAMTDWLWHSRRVVIVDGSTSPMADTPKNQEAFPQSTNQPSGLGFPVMRWVVLLSLQTGTVLNCAMGACRGKKTGEASLFQQMWHTFEPGDIVVADRLYDSYRDIALLKRDGVDSILGKKPSRRCDFRKGRKLGANDHVVIWRRPPYDPSRYESKEQWESLPREMEMREVRITVRRPSYATRQVVIVTTLLDASIYSAADLMDLFAQRWHCELDLRSIKQALGMTHLNCKTPEAVRRELWTYLLAYNLIRVRMAQAAAKNNVLPRQLSFTAAKTLLETFTPFIRVSRGNERLRLEAAMLDAMAESKVKRRPGRKEPRAVKKRVQKYSYLTKPRAQARKGLKA